MQVRFSNTIVRFNNFAKQPDCHVLNATVLVAKHKQKFSYWNFQPIRMCLIKSQPLLSELYLKQMYLDKQEQFRYWLFHQNGEQRTAGCRRCLALFFRLWQTFNAKCSQLDETTIASLNQKTTLTFCYLAKPPAKILSSLNLINRFVCSSFQFLFLLHFIYCCCGRKTWL